MSKDIINKYLINEGFGKFLKIWSKIALGMNVSDLEYSYATPGFVDFDTPFEKAVMDSLKKAKTFKELMSISKDLDYFEDRISLKVYTRIGKAFENKAKKLGLWKED